MRNKSNKDLEKLNVSELEEMIEDTMLNNQTSRTLHLLNILHKKSIQSQTQKHRNRI